MAFPRSFVIVVDRHRTRAFKKKCTGLGLARTNTLRTRARSKTKKPKDYLPLGRLVVFFLSYTVYIYITVLTIKCARRVGYNYPVRPHAFGFAEQVRVWIFVLRLNYSGNVWKRKRPVIAERRSGQRRERRATINRYDWKTITHSA